MFSLCFWNKQGNSVTRDLPPTGSEANTILFVYIYIGYRFPLSLSTGTIVFLNKKIILFFIPRIIFSRNVGNSINARKILPPPPPPPIDMFEIKNQNKGIEDYIGYIDSHCPYLLFGETTSHLTSKWRGTFQYFFIFTVENSIKRAFLN